ncbi:MAG TPA: hypothetical protein VKA34_14665 [Balneolales bacterium]|nr:hypothetical protein [Balneolales bacterium]
MRKWKSHIILFSLFLLGSFLLPRIDYAQESPFNYYYPQNQLKWYTIQSKHFLIHFQKGNSRVAQVVSRVAEEVYGPITKLYHHKPDTRISIVLIDRDDYANGATYFFDNMIDIWVPALNMPLRGTHNWFRNVITHEFTHMIQIQSAMKRNRRVPAIYFQWLTYENVRRPDVLYGFPKGVITMPFASVSIPGWFAEGTAQFQRIGLHYDNWDSHRDMVLRTRVLNHSLLSLPDMGNFSSKTSIEREVVYNQGFAFVRYLANRFGENVLYNISKALSEKGVNDISKALKIATGTNGVTLYSQWRDTLQTMYTHAIRNVHRTPSDTLEPKGFFNLNPKFSPNGHSVAYLSNKDHDTYRVDLYIKNINNDTSKLVIREADHVGIGRDNTFSDGAAIHPGIKIDETGFDFSPNGKKIVYSNHALTKYGESYRDLYIYNLQTKEKKRLTHGERIYEPSWNPDGKTIAAVIQKDETQNLVLFHVANDSISRLTHFKNGEQIYHSSWTPDGQNLYFAAANLKQQAIYHFNLKSRKIISVLKDNKDDSVDYRDPSVGPNGQYLYYSSNPDGIYNIYRMNIQNGKRQQLTSVLGGAFMPSINEKGQLVYAEYMADGYKISMARLPTLLSMHSDGSYHDPLFKTDTERFTQSYTKLNKFNDEDLHTLPAVDIAKADTGTYHFDISTRGQANTRELYSYKDTFTSFSFYPVIRFDNYARPYGPNGRLLTAGKIGDLAGNLWRDAKIGFYMSSHDVLNRFSIYGGALFGFGSEKTKGIGNFISPTRLQSLDRDLFLEVSYDGLPFIKRRWSPTVTVDLYNMRRNVKNGLSVEEFPCSSCLPDTNKVNIAYNIWEADMYLRSKINNYNLVELGLTYSPYQVQTESFYSREYKSYLAASSSKYYIGTGVTAAYIFDMDTPYRNDDIAPLGIKGQLRLNYQPSKLLDNYEIKDGSLSPNYKTYRNSSVEMSFRYGFRALDHTAEFKTRFFTYFNNPSDYFFLDYIGGLSGMRSYPYFGLGGITTAYTELSYNMPLITHIDKQYGRFTLDKIYSRFFVEAGNGWGGPLNIGKNIKTGVGAELRVSLDTNYLFPSKFFISGAYGLNKFNVHLPDAFLTNSGNNTVSYGHRVLINFGLLFSFDM